jgi:hypothetical protein
MFSEPTEKHIQKKVLRSMSDVPEIMRERLLHDAKNHYEAEMPLLNLLNKFKNKATYLAMTHDYLTEEELSQLHEELRAGKKAHNDAIERELDEALNWGKRYGNRKFYLPQRMTLSGRFIIDSNVINGQTSKIHRFLFSRKGWKRNVVKGKLNTKDHEALMMAIGLGMGLKTDTTLRADIVRQVENAFTEDGDWLNAMRVIQNADPDSSTKFTEEEEQALAKVLGAEGTHTFAALKAAADYFGAANGETVEISLPHETDGVTNGFIIGLMVTAPGELTPKYRKMLNAGGIYFSDDPWKNLAEYKAAGNLDNYEQLAQSTRANLKNIQAKAKAVADAKLMEYNKKSKIKQRIPGRNIRVQRKLVHVVKSGLVASPDQLQQENRETEEERKLSAEGRKEAKDPLIQTSYGAGENSIRRQAVNSAFDKFYEKLATSQTIDDLRVNLNRAYGMINMVVRANNEGNIPRNAGTDSNGRSVWRKWEYLGTRHPSGYLTNADVQAIVDKNFGGDIRLAATTFKLSAPARNLMSVAIQNTYGEALWGALNEVLEPVMRVRKRLNVANQFMNMMYVKAYQAEVKKITDAGRIVTDRKKRNIMNQLMLQGLVPSIATATSAGVTDSLEMTKMRAEALRISPNKLMESVAFLQKKMQIKSKQWGLNGVSREGDKVPQTRTLTARLNTWVPSSDVGVGAVVKTIHALDGVINSLLWGQGPHSIMNIHDAQLSPWYAAEGIAKDANTGFMETIGNYDMPAKFRESMDRLMTSLWGTDGSLSTQDQEEIAEVMAAMHASPAGSFLEAGTPLEIDIDAEGIDVDIGNWVIDELDRQLKEDALSTYYGKSNIFSDVRYVNQFAQDGAEVHTPNGIELGKPTEWADERDDNIESLEDAVTNNEFVDDQDPDILFAEEFADQLESEKVLNTWEGLAQYETGDVDVSHTNHLRNLIKNLVAPGLTSIEPIYQYIEEQAATNGHQANMVGDILRLRTAANVLTSNVQMSLQERAAQEYVAAIVNNAINDKDLSDHFVRKEVRRLFELAQDNITPDMLIPADATGDPAINLELAQERYNYIFDNTNPDEAYTRFIAIGLTNKPFMEALATIDNTSTSALPVVNWDKGYLRALMSVFRQMLQKLAGVGERYEGGSVSDAVAAIANTTIAVNQRNQQRLKDLRLGVDGTSRIQKINQSIVNAVNDRFVEPLAKGLEATNKKRLDPDNPTLPGFLKAATYVALSSRNDEVRAEYNRFYRKVIDESGADFGKDNGIFQTIAEVTPWKDENLNWISLLRKSKYMVDMARQEVTDNTRAFINDSFDKKQHKSKAHKMAITNTILKTDLVSLLDNDNDGLNLGQLAELLKSRAAREAERNRLETMLRQEVTKEGKAELFYLFQNQARSLASLQTRGVATVENPMMNAYNIVHQFMLKRKHQTALKDYKTMESVVDRLATIYALEMQDSRDLMLTNEIVEHEMNRTDITAENGFSRLIGMHGDFKQLAKQNLFKDQPIQMLKGYVYEIFDGDVNVEYVEEGSDRQIEVEAEGMVLVGELSKDSLDNYKGKRLLYKGLKGLNTYNKSIVSLTDLQHRGANLFSTNGYQSQRSLENLADSRDDAFTLAGRNQFKANYVKPGANMVPVLNNRGEIVDYRYLMSERNKRKILKKEDPFDRVLPRMFASINDRNSTKDINDKVVKLLGEEYRAGRNDPGIRFVKVGINSLDKNGRDMWNLLPEQMQRAARREFGFDGIYVRDDVANLVLGFRKATLSNLKTPGDPNGGVIWGKNTPVVRIAEKVWQEIVSLMRIKIAILTPAVVVGNIASNTAMLLSEGIPLNYIRKNASEAISGMRQYQKDRAKATALMRQIGSNQALGKNTRALEVRLARLEAELAANPVGQLVEAGLFTSITADLGVDDDTIRGSMIQKAEDALGNKGGKAGKAAAHLVKEAYMLPGSKGYQAAVAATQYGDFVGRYIKFKYDTQVNKLDKEQAINEALAAFIYYDIPQPKYLQALNDSGLVMFTKFFTRIQHVVARMYSQNPASAFAVLGMQKALLPDPFNENIMNYGMGDGLTNKFNNPLNLPGKAWNTLNPTEPALLQWILNPFGL